jgi:hypothetical protein
MISYNYFSFSWEERINDKHLKWMITSFTQLCHIVYNITLPILKNIKIKQIKTKEMNENWKSCM